MIGIAFATINVFNKVAFVCTILVGWQSPASEVVVGLPCHWLGVDQFGSNVAFH
jgi:hypothetical protein